MIDQRLLIFGEQRVFPAAILEPRLLLSSIIPEPLRALLPIDLRRTLISIATRSRVLPRQSRWVPIQIRRNSEANRHNRRPAVGIRNDRDAVSSRY
jgi:hypothetical protein